MAVFLYYSYWPCSIIAERLYTYTWNQINQEDPFERNTMYTTLHFVNIIYITETLTLYIYIYTCMYVCIKCRTTYYNV